MTQEEEEYILYILYILKTKNGGSLGAGRMGNITTNTNVMLPYCYLCLTDRHEATALPTDMKQTSITVVV